MKRFKLLDNVTGWIIFMIAAATYLMTIEPSASFWDCGEFIISAFKLEVGHPPGAPLFMLVGNILANIGNTLGSIETVPIMINSMSAVASALTILFLFWSITHLARRLLVKDEQPVSLAQTITILGCGAVGALAYTYSDTFWFSAVEGEVYATSSLFTAVVFWAILKWEEQADAPHADRWIILIAYLMGLSIGVHLLNLLCIPAIVLVYYYKRFKNPTLKGTVYALLISFVIVAVMLYGIVQGLVEVCGWFELLFVNTFKMPYNSGVLAYVLIISGVLIWAIWETMRKKPDDKRMKIAFILSIVLLGIPFIGQGIWLGIIIIIALTVYMFVSQKIQTKILNTTLISLMVIVIGYSTFALILIRSTADTPMNENYPRDVFSLRGYIAREQYGDTPLLYGRTYVSELERERKSDYCPPKTDEGVPTWSRVEKTTPGQKDEYYISNENRKVRYMKETCMLFPRMHSSQDANHISGYKEWGQVKGTPVRIPAQCGADAKTIMKPTFAENLRFFFDYQLNFMYWRYFMWNFAGRQNDIQGFGSVLNGNWITGIKAIDTVLIGPQDDMPADMVNNKGHNKYYLLPLILGLLGILYQIFCRSEKGIQSFLITFFLFFMTGIAVVLYLNQTPYQPRERDYAYAGSFYAFCIWIGIGVAAIAKAFEKLKLSPATSGALASVLCLLVPVQMASQTWDDHDRSNRTAARDFARNYLESCEQNAIIFTHGDNDTFPLWYAQEVEGIRTDVRVCNTSYLQTDWYANQMKKAAYDSDPLPISWRNEDYIQGTRDYAYVTDSYNKPLDLTTALNFVKSNDPKTRLSMGDATEDFFPSKQLFMTIDSAKVIEGNTISEEYVPYIEKELNINLDGKSILTKCDILMLDMVNTNQWKRPIYYAITVPGSVYQYFSNNLQKTGMAFQIVPFSTKDNLLATNTAKMYDNVMNKFTWGGLDKPGVYIDQTIMNMVKSQRAVIFGDLAANLINENKLDSALQVLDRCIEVFPAENAPHDYASYNIAYLYYQLGQKEKAQAIVNDVVKNLLTNINWMLRLSPSKRNSILEELDYEIRKARQVISSTYQFDQEFVKQYMEEFNQYMGQYQSITNTNK
jgi:tetratricopeptide (TPR) repeat protein